MANPFSVNVPSLSEAITSGEQGYSAIRQLMMGREQDAARKAAQEDLMNGDTRSALARLLGANDPKSAAVLSAYQTAQQAGQGVYGTPIYGTNERGETVLGAIGKQGQFQLLDTGGITPTPGVRMIDTGTGFVPVQSRTGQPVQGGTYQPGQAQPGVPQPQTGFIPKDVAGEARQKVVGKEEGEVQANLAAMRGKLPGLLEVVKKLGEIGDQATYTSAGQLLDYGRTQAGMDPRKSAIARTTYIAMVDNQVLPLLRETFGAQFTQKEGESLKTTLGDPNKTPQEKRAVLDAFIQQKVRNVASLEQQLSKPQSGQPTVPPPPPKMNEVRGGYRYKGGDPASPESWINMRLK